MKTTVETVTIAQINSLRAGASRAGDTARVHTCDAALSGDADAIAECARVITARESALATMMRGAGFEE